MALQFDYKLQEALKAIGFQHHHIFNVHHHKEERSFHNTDDIMEQYALANWALVDLLNGHFSNITHLENWLDDKKEDEIAFFLNEAGSNVLSHSQYKAPAAFHLWLGKKGLIIGIEQMGKGFNAQEAHEQRIKTNEGAAFDFFRNAQNIIFFNKAQDATIIFMRVMVPKFTSL